jgi:trimeric autotransporter adhesin
MRPLSQNADSNSRRAARSPYTALPIVALIASAACTLGCSGGITSSVVAPLPAPPPTASSVSVTVTPTTSSVLLGNTQTFTPSVTGPTNTAVSWSVNGVPGGSPTTGTITAAGDYTAPQILPALTTVTVAAQSVADPTKQASAIITILSDITVALTPSTGAVELGATQPFHAAISSSGQPNPAIRWSVSGPACPAACGSLDTNGNYTAPQILPAVATVTLTAQSIADPSRQASATVTITSNFSLRLSAPASIASGGSGLIAVTLTPIPGSSPSTALSWALSGAACGGTVCGVLTVVTTQVLAGGAMSTSATYTAPVAPPSPNTVTITVTPQADPTKKAQATVAIQPGVGVTLSPGTATLAGNHRVTLTAQVFGTATTGVAWTVNGVPNGSGTVGQICVAASNPCQPLTTGNNLQVDYQAPGAIPSPNPVTVRATSIADTTRSATAQITVINHVIVTVMPATVTLAPLAVQGLSATVLGATNQSVVWQIQGTACSAPGACGAIDANGIYTAPGAAPVPNALTIAAISADDPSQSGLANVAIATGAAILSLHPASVYAGAANGFTLRVDGSNFAASAPGPGSALLIGGTARTTTCNSVTECTAPVTPADVSAPGNLAIQVRNPDGTTSNSVSLIVAAPNASAEIISLTGGAPSATAQDIIVVDHTTAGVSLPNSDVDLNVAALGAFSTVTNSCSLAGNPVPLQRPAIGVAAADICLFSAGGLDTSMAYTVSGPGDVTVIAKQPAGLGIIHLTLQIFAVAIPGARTLFIQNTNLDKTAATGALEVQ